MPAKAKHRSSLAADEQVAPEAAITTVLAAAPLDAPPSFLEKSESPAPEQVAHG